MFLFAIIEGIAKRRASIYVLAIGGILSKKDAQGRGAFAYSGFMRYKGDMSKSQFALNKGSNLACFLCGIFLPPEMSGWG